MPLTIPHNTVLTLIAGLVALIVSIFTLVTLHDLHAGQIKGVALRGGAPYNDETAYKKARNVSIAIAVISALTVTVSAFMVGKVSWFIQ